MPLPHKIASALTTIGVLSAAVPVLAQPPLIAAELDVPASPPVVLNIPQQAIDRSPAIVPLGTAVDPATGKIVEGIAFIHYRKGYHHRPGHSGGPAGGNGSTAGSCFSYLARGAKWKAVEPWVMNGSNAEGLDPTALFNLQSAALVKWEDAADGVVGNGTSVDIFGGGSQTAATLVADTSSPDGQNEVYFGDVSTSGAIAVTIVWGFFSGPPKFRELVEWDQVYDQADFNWSAGAEGAAGKMDFDNIATHENGHAAGMGHPDDSCTEETMYRFADFAEIKKRDLNAGDIAGVDALY